MFSLTKARIKTEIADSHIIYKRGISIFNLGNYTLKEGDFDRKSFCYDIDGNYGDYDVNIDFINGKIRYRCTCAYYSDGCKHTVAACLDLIERIALYKNAKEIDAEEGPLSETDNLSYDEIRAEAIEERKKKARNEGFELTLGESYKGEHLVRNAKGREYVVTLHEPTKGLGHCSCPDFNTNKLNTCKHLIHLYAKIKTKRGFAARIKRETLPFLHLYWDAAVARPRYVNGRALSGEKKEAFSQCFDADGYFMKGDLIDLYPLLEKMKGRKNIKVDTHLLQKVNEALFEKEIALHKSAQTFPDDTRIKTTLYPYQKEGIRFALYKKSAIIADEMGLGKTLQAITLAIFKQEIFQFSKVLVICPASLKEQWRLEIERFTDEKACVIAGSKEERQALYEKDQTFFKITNYEAVLRDKLVIQRFRPDLIILDEAQRIKNFETLTAQAIKAIPHKHSLVITGTPLENKLEDLYSIVQFADPKLLTPLWEFAAEHFILKKEKKNKIFGYRNLDHLHEKLKPLVIRRKKEEVLDDLPEQVTNNYYIDLTQEQHEIHQGYVRSLLPLVNKKFLTPIDIQRIQQLLTAMRMVCDSTFLIDRKTNLSPKLKELQGILTDLVLDNKRKVVLFTEWTTMTFLIGKVLSELGIPFIEFTGKVPVAKRQKLINEFNENKDCKVFLATEAGGVGLNLQAADCVINFELPWNPAKLKQRIGRVMRIGQKSRCVNVINLIAKHSIEEKILAGLHLKQALFSGVFDGGAKEVVFSQEKKTAFINRIRAMLNEEPEVPTREAAEVEEIPESTPHYLNPKVLAQNGSEATLDMSGEEVLEGTDVAIDLAEHRLGDDTTAHGSDPLPSEKVPTSPEKIEEVLESGMQFLSGLMAMATGKPLLTEGQEKQIHVDRETGEVTMKFKLPGFPR